MHRLLTHTVLHAEGIWRCETTLSFSRPGLLFLSNTATRSTDADVVASSLTLDFHHHVRV